jgi:hypothetical protein
VSRFPRLRLLWYVAALIAGGGYLAWLLLGRYLPAANGRIGPDYSYFLPHLLDGQYFGAENRLGAIRWFTPAFCGGMPTWADPQDPFVTLAQWLTFLVTPLHAVQATVILFALAGAVGTYLFARRRLSVSRPAATVSGALVLANGFYLDRMIVGHFGFQSFMLVPCVAFLVSGERGRWSVARMVGAAVLLAYMLHAGLLTIFPVALCAIVLLLTLRHLVAPPAQSNPPPMSPPRAIWQRLGMAMVLALGISAAKSGSGIWLCMRPTSALRLRLRCAACSSARRRRRPKRFRPRSAGRSRRMSWNTASRRFPPCCWLSFYSSVSGYAARDHLQRALEHSRYGRLLG